MVPGRSDAATELFHWQRYLYFQPWYRDIKVVDAAGGEGYGANFASIYATQATGIDVSEEAVKHATERYPEVAFQVADVCNYDYSDADLVTSFETIEHLPDPRAFLEALKTCKGTIVISTPNRKTHSPGNSLESKPLNPYHTIEWTPNEFAQLIQTTFEGRTVRFLSQEARWPGLIREGLDDEAMYCIAVIGDAELPKWPRLGLTIPTCQNSSQVIDAVTHLSRFYPGEMEFAIVSNGCSEDHRANLRKLRDSAPYMFHLIESDENLGYGRGANLGFNFLWQESWFDYFGVVNDDVIPAVACTIEMVNAMGALQGLGHKPGMIGPMSNRIHGRQFVEIGGFQETIGMNYRAERFHRAHHSSATEHAQVRGLYLLIHPDCLNEIGGFDPRFGLGNFEDDDYNLRAKLAGFSCWIADGAFLYHHGSTTFQKLELNYQGTIDRNREIFQWKWDLANIDEWPNMTLADLPEEQQVSRTWFIPLLKEAEHEFSVNINGRETVDLIHQASDTEFAAWVYERMRHRPRDFRREIVKIFTETPVRQSVAA